MEMDITKSLKMSASEIHDQDSLANVLWLLKENNLPFKDVVLDGNLFMNYKDSAGELIGAGGLEFYGVHSLLRSVVVTKAYRGKKIGHAIVLDLLARGKYHSIKKVYLLTETAHDFFINLGFKDVSRENVPNEVRASLEFASVCPASAACMEFEIEMLREH